MVIASTPIKFLILIEIISVFHYLEYHFLLDVDEYSI